MFRLLRSLPVVALLLIVGGCASSRLGDIQPLPKDLPADLQRKFEVLEAKTGPAPEVSPSPMPQLKLSKKEIAKAKREAKKVKSKAAFVYPNRRTKINPIWIGEQQVLEITYIGLKAGEFTLDVLPMKQLANRSVYHLRAHAVSSSMMNLFYRLNDTVESFWDYEGLFSHRFHMLLDQTRQKRDALELYDSETKKVFYWNRRNHIEKGISESKETFDIELPFSQDSFSALYYLRTLPLEDGKVYAYPVISEGRGWEAVVTVVRREMQDTPMGKRMCIVVKPQTRYNGVMKQEKGESFIWLTDDDRRFIVRLEAQVKVGAVAAQLKKVELGEKPNAE